MGSRTHAFSFYNQCINMTLPIGIVDIKSTTIAKYWKVGRRDTYVTLHDVRVHKSTLTYFDILIVSKQILTKVCSVQVWRWLLENCIFGDFFKFQKANFKNHEYLEKMSLKVSTSFAIHRKRIFYALKNIVMQLPFNSCILSDDRFDSLDFKSWEKIFLDQPWNSIFEGLLLVTYFCDLWTLW